MPCFAMATIFGGKEPNYISILAFWHQHGVDDIAQELGYGFCFHLISLFGMSLTKYSSLQLGD